MRAFLATSIVLIAVRAGAQPPPPPPPPQPSGGVTGGIVGSGPQGGIVRIPATPARDAVARPVTGTARISGRILAADSGAPLRRAQVRLMGGALREPQSITTDADGNFAFGNLPAGSYTINAQKTNFLTMTYGQKRPSTGPGKPVKIADGQTLDRIDFAMIRAGVISGRVVDDVGEPAPNSMVQAARPRADGPMMMSGSAQTDDLGQFRLHGLQPGEYIVSVSPRNINMMMSGDLLDRTGYAQTFFPGTASLAEAQKIPVQAGLETPNVQISLMLMPLAKVSGVVMDPKGGKPSQSGSVQIRPAGNMPMFGGAGGGIRPDGTFVINSVAPGSYNLEVRSGGGPGPDQQQLFATAPIVVNGEDVTNVVLMLSTGATARGKIIFEGGEPPPLRQGMNVVSAGPIGPNEMMGPSGPGKTFEDWTFELKGLFGRKMLRAGSPAPGWMLKSITYGTTDITDIGVEFKGSDVFDGFEVKFVKSTTSIEATVTDAAGQPAADAVLLIFTTDREKWAVYQSRYIRLVYPNPEGRLMVSQLPPGDYYAIAVEAGEPGFERNPEALDTFSRSAERFALFDGEKKQLALRYTPQ